MSTAIVMQWTAICWKLLMNAAQCHHSVLGLYCLVQSRSLLRCSHRSSIPGYITRHVAFWNWQGKFWGKEQRGLQRVTLLCIIAYCTRSSATAEKQRVSCACLPRLANWSCNAQNTAESQRLYYSWHSNALIQEVLAENAFCHEIAAQGHW